MTEFAFRRSSRLLTGQDFQGVFSGARYKISHRNLLILAIPNNRPRPRLGMVIGKRHIRLAVQRNRIKRHIRESFRLHQHTLPHVDAIVLARGQLDQLSDRKLNSTLEKQWSRLCQQASRDRESCEDQS